MISLDKDKDKDKDKELSYEKLIKFIHKDEKNMSEYNIGLFFDKFIKGHENKKNREILKKLESFRFNFLSDRSDKVEVKMAGFVQVYDESLESIYPLVCGLGSVHVLETSITLHRIWGVPYIPGSSLKGVCRQVAFWKIVEKRNIMTEGELKSLQSKFYGSLCSDDKDIFYYQLLFGGQNFKGLLLFLDVYPDLSDFNIKLDIMNPHYPSYYSDDSGKTVAGDWENPVPINFVTVKPGVKFKFRVLFDDYRWNKLKEKGIEVEISEREKKKISVSEEIKDRVSNLIADENRYNFFKDILRDALSIYGIGAKTRLGYGSFKVDGRTGEPFDMEVGYGSFKV